MPTRPRLAASGGTHCRGSILASVGRPGNHQRIGDPARGLPRKRRRAIMSPSSSGLPDTEGTMCGRAFSEYDLHRHTSADRGAPCLNGCANCGGRGSRTRRKRRSYRSPPRQRRAPPTKPTARTPERPEPRHTGLSLVPEGEFSALSRWWPNRHGRRGCLKEAATPYSLVFGQLQQVAAMRGVGPA